MRSLEEMIGQRAGGAKWHNRFRVVSFQGAPKLREPRILRGANPQRTSASLRQQRTAQLEEEEEDEEDGPTPAPTTNPTFSPTTESPMLPCLRDPTEADVFGFFITGHRLLRNSMFIKGAEGPKLIFSTKT